MIDFVDEVLHDTLALASFHDVMQEVVKLPQPCTNDWLRSAFSQLPRSIQIEALQWGLDTCVRDEIYLHFQKYGLNL